MGNLLLKLEVETVMRYVKKVDEGDEGRRKNMRMTTERKTYKNLNYFKILADSLHGEGEVLEKFLASDGSAHSEKKPEYNFGIQRRSRRRNRSFDEELNKLFAFCEMSIAAEDIGSASPEVDKGYHNSRPVIIAPKSMLLTWEEEFRKWNINIPFHNMNSQEFSGHENPAAVYSSKKIRGSRNNESVTRVVKLLSWKMGKSILGITYSLFDKLVRGETRNADCTPMTDQMGKALLKFPTVLILDEGHTPLWNPSVERQAISRAYRIGQKMLFTPTISSQKIWSSKNTRYTLPRISCQRWYFSSKEMNSCRDSMPNITEDTILHEMFQQNEKLGGMFKEIIY
ncbi:hypothetical protein AG4045_028606 [Apium graveolens]|uniref:SNF2 N-terminal domain-containing protein n=1 Tax=Apium graveolens TaxID=4045 RepID=A0A6L5BCH6_APIGR|nr:hypothetical protein AG4045_028606 [Apium graveolens]